MKTVILGVACLLGALGARAQERKAADIPVQQDVEFVFIARTPDGEEFTIGEIIVDHGDISLEYLNTSQIDSLLGKSDKSRVVMIIHVDRSANLLDKEELLAYYNIPKKYWTLPLKVDGKKIREPGTLLANVNMVHDVRVGDNGTYITIYTKYYPNSGPGRQKAEQRPSCKTPGPVQAVSAQKKLSELQVTLDSSKFEKVSSASIPALVEEQRQKGGGFETFYEIYKPRNRETSQLYMLRETRELIAVTSRLNKVYKEKWDRQVGVAIEMFTREEFGRKRYVEHLEGETYRAVIFFLKEHYGVYNRIMYKNPGKDAYLGITYMSDLPDEAKIKNMRKIVNGLRID